MSGARFVDIALSFQGAPYIWGGKGLWQWKDGKFARHKFVDDKNISLMVFDCSGLVTQSLFLQSNGFIDLRATHSAKTILDTFPECKADYGDGCLILYKSHVAIDIGRGRVVEANRGDQSTLSLLDAQNQGAKVEVHRSVRPTSSILGYRRIPKDLTELTKPNKDTNND